MRARVVAVVGACGGVGGSTLAALLAEDAARPGRGSVRRSRGRAGAGGRTPRVVLVDLARTGGGLEVLLGLEERPGARWPDLRQVRGAVAAGDLDGLLPRWAGCEVLSGDRRGGPGPEPQVLRDVWAALVDGHDLVVVDLPAHALADAAVRDVVLGAGAHVHVLTGQDVIGVAAALAIRPFLDEPRTAAAVDARADLVLRRVRGARVSPLEAAQLLDLPLAGLLPTDRAMTAATDRGLGPVLGRRTPLARAVRGLASPPLPAGGRMDTWLLDATPPDATSPGARASGATPPGASVPASSAPTWSGPASSAPAPSAPGSSAAVRVSGTTLRDARAGVPGRA